MPEKIFQTNIADGDFLLSDWIENNPQFTDAEVQLWSISMNLLQPGQSFDYETGEMMGTITMTRVQ